MRYMFKFPDIGEGLEEGKIVQWYVEKGQSIKSGDPVVKMETDKVVTDIPSPKSGVIAQRFGGEGDTVHVGSVLVEIDIEGVSGGEAVTEARSTVPEKHAEVVEEKGFGVVGTIEVAGDGAYLPSSGEGLSPKLSPEEPVKSGKVLATPVARAMAKELKVDINLIKGSGPAGRVMKKDIEQYHSSKGYLTQEDITTKAALPASERISYEPLSMIRKTIAKNMNRSKQNAAHMSVMDEVEVSELVSARKKLNQALSAQGQKLSYLPFVIKAVAIALKEHSILNAEIDLENDRIVYKHFYNIGIAVDTDDGLVVPVIRDADRKSLIMISDELAEISRKSRERKLTLQDMKDGTFTITSYGSIGGYFAVPVINYPQVGILGIGTIKEKPVVRDHQIAVGEVMPISMSVDHRIVDGGEVARFLNRVLQLLNEPMLMLANLGGE